MGCSAPFQQCGRGAAPAGCAEMKRKLETEILPFIKRQIEELRRKLEKTGEEEKLKYVDQKIELIAARLRS